MSQIRRPDSRRGGFTLVEVLLVAAIMGILVGIAIPNMRTVIHRARAADASANMEVVRVAVLNYQADQLSWPAETAAGVIPTGLASYLPEGFDFTEEAYLLDFESWSLPGGLPGEPNTTALIGVSVVAIDQALGNALVELLGGALVFSVGNTHTIIIDRS